MRHLGEVDLGCPTREASAPVVQVHGGFHGRRHDDAAVLRTIGRTSATPGIRTRLRQAAAAVATGDAATAGGAASRRTAAVHLGRRADGIVAAILTTLRYASRVRSRPGEAPRTRGAASACREQRDRGQRECTEEWASTVHGREPRQSECPLQRAANAAFVSLPRYLRSHQWHWEHGSAVRLSTAPGARSCAFSTKLHCDCGGGGVGVRASNNQVRVAPLAVLDGLSGSRRWRRRCRIGTGWPTPRLQLLSGEWQDRRDLPRGRPHHRQWPRRGDRRIREPRRVSRVRARHRVPMIRIG